MSKLDQGTKRPRLPDQITIEFGPTEFLARYLLALDRAVRSRGVFLSIREGLDGLLAVNLANRSSWIHLPPLFNSEVWGSKRESAFWIVGHDTNGDVVTTQAATLYRWESTHLHEELQSLRLFYPHPEVQATPREECRSHVASAHKINGAVVFSGATWVHPKFRHKDLPYFLPRISRACAYAKWDTRFTISTIRTQLIAKGIATKYGYRNVEEAIIWNRPALDDYAHLALVWMAADELLSDAFTFHRTPLITLPPDLRSKRDIDVRTQQGIHSN